MSEEIALKAMNRIIRVFHKNGFGLREDTHHYIVEIVKMFVCKMNECKDKEEVNGSVNSDS